MELNNTPLENPFKHLGRNTFEFRLTDTKKFNNELITFNSDFDSGNCKSVE
jgi:hypothetical protein